VVLAALLLGGSVDVLVEDLRQRLARKTWPIVVEIVEVTGEEMFTERLASRPEVEALFVQGLEAAMPTEQEAKRLPSRVPTKTRSSAPFPAMAAATCSTKGCRQRNDALLTQSQMRVTHEVFEPAGALPAVSEALKSQTVEVVDGFPSMGMARPDQLQLGVRQSDAGDGWSVNGIAGHHGQISTTQSGGPQPVRRPGTADRGRLTDGIEGVAFCGLPVEPTNVGKQTHLLREGIYRSTLISAHGRRWLA